MFLCTSTSGKCETMTGRVALPLCYRPGSRITPLLSPHCFLFSFPMSRGVINPPSSTLTRRMALRYDECSAGVTGDIRGEVVVGQRRRGTSVFLVFRMPVYFGAKIIITSIETNLSLGKLVGWSFKEVFPPFSVCVCVLAWILSNRGYESGSLTCEKRNTLVFSAHFTI